MKKKHVLSFILAVLLMLSIIPANDVRAAGLIIPLEDGSSYTQYCFHSRQTMTVSCRYATTNVTVQGKPSWVTCVRDTTTFKVTVSQNSTGANRYGDVVFRDGTKVYRLRIYQSDASKELTVTFNANGGTVTKRTINTAAGWKYGSLPIPTRKGYDFLGWYTECSGGIKITANTTITKNYNHVLYAHWRKK
jgi:uncharacterized repeat protein (TIGR02543 family)